jgi:hypothetical protein
MLNTFYCLFHDLLGAEVYAWIAALDFCCAMEGVVMK